MTMYEREWVLSQCRTLAYKSKLSRRWQDWKNRLKKPTHTCQKCNIEFKAYQMYENCKACGGDGECYDYDEEEYSTCMGCGGEGDHEWLEMDYCEGCLQQIYEEHN